MTKKTQRQMKRMINHDEKNQRQMKRMINHDRKKTKTNEKNEKTICLCFFSVMIDHSFHLPLVFLIMIDHSFHLPLGFFRHD
jgi:hypothetical protein